MSEIEAEIGETRVRSGEGAANGDGHELGEQWRA